MRSISLLLLITIPLLAVAPKGDINLDNKVDASDMVLLNRLLAKEFIPKEHGECDLDNDGEFTTHDQEWLKNKILNKPQETFIKQETIPTTGGTIGNEDAQLTIPDNTLNIPATIKLWSSTQPTGFEENGNTDIILFSGIPAKRNQTMTIKIADTSTATEGETVLMGLGEKGYTRYRGQNKLSFQIVEATKRGNWLEFILPATPNAELANNDNFTIAVCPIENYESYIITDPTNRNRSTPVSFQIFCPVYLDVVAGGTFSRAMLNSYLIKAAQKIKGLGFDFTKRSRTMPIKIHVTDLGTAWGEYEGSYFGLNSTCISFDYIFFNKKTKNNEIQATIIHELFHLAQALYDPRSSYKQKTTPCPQLWIDEAASVWSEKLMLTTPTNPSIMKRNINEIFHGMHMPFNLASEQSDAANHGYGMAIFFDYLLQLPPYNQNTFWINTYNKIFTGTDPHTAINDQFLEDADKLFEDFLIAFAKLEIGVPKLPLEVNQNPDHKKIFFFEKTFAKTQQKNINDTLKCNFQLADLHTQSISVAAKVVDFNKFTEDTYLNATFNSRSNNPKLRIMAFQDKPGVKELSYLGDAYEIESGITGLRKWRFLGNNLIKDSKSQKISFLVLNKQNTVPFTYLLPHTTVVGEFKIIPPFEFSNTCNSNQQFKVPSYKLDGVLNKVPLIEEQDLGSTSFSFHYGKIPRLNEEIPGEFKIKLTPISLKNEDYTVGEIRKIVFKVEFCDLVGDTLIADDDETYTQTINNPGYGENIFNFPIKSSDHKYIGVQMFVHADIINNHSGGLIFPAGEWRMIIMSFTLEKEEEK